MEQLTLLCATESRAWKVPADMLEDTEHLEARSRWDFFPAMTLSSLELAPGLAAYCGWIT